MHTRYQPTWTNLLCKTPKPLIIISVPKSIIYLSNLHMFWGECISAAQYTPLHWAAVKGHKEAVKVLISKGANALALADVSAA